MNTKCADCENEGVYLYNGVDLCSDHVTTREQQKDDYYATEENQTSGEVSDLSSEPGLGESDGQPDVSED